MIAVVMIYQYAFEVINSRFSTLKKCWRWDTINSRALCYDTVVGSQKRESPQREQNVLIHIVTFYRKSPEIKLGIQHIAAFSKAGGLAQCRKTIVQPTWNVVLSHLMSLCYDIVVGNHKRESPQREQNGLIHIVTFYRK